MKYFIVLNIKVDAKDDKEAITKAKEKIKNGKFKNNDLEIVEVDGELV